MIKHEISDKYFYTSVEKIEKACQELHFSTKLSDGSFEFTNSYAIPYFSAKYYIHFYEEKEEQILSLIDRLEDPLIANTVLFIVRNFKNSKIINKIIDLNKSLFENIDEIKCEEDVKVFDDLITNVCDIKRTKTVRENNIELFRRMDYARKKSIKKHQITSLENELIKSNRINEISKEIILQQISKTQTRELALETYKMLLRRATISILIFRAALNEISKKSNDEIKKNWNDYEDRLIKLISVTVTLIISLAENSLPTKFHYLLNDIVTNEQRKEIDCLIEILLEIIGIRNKEVDLNYDKVIAFRNKLLKSKKNFCYSILSCAISREINYIGMSDKVSRVLLDKWNSERINYSLLNPKERLNKSKNNKKKYVNRLSKKY